MLLEYLTLQLTTLKKDVYCLNFSAFNNRNIFYVLLFYGTV